MTAFGYLGALLYGGICLLFSSVLYKVGVPKKYTRKIVHIMVGFEWVILYHTVGVGIHFVVVCLAFTALLAISYKMRALPMISSDGDNAPGTVYYGISMSIMAILSCFFDDFVFAFGIAVFCTSIGDGFAGVLGATIKKCNPRIYKSKTLVGTCAAFLFSMLSIALFSLIYSLNLSFLNIIAISLLASGLELISGRGLDNITIPLGAAAFSYLLMNIESTADYIAPIVLTPFVVCFAIEKRVLSGMGVVLALVLDLFISLSLKSYGFILLLSFLLLSVVADKIKKRFKKKRDEISMKGDQRDGIQVLANGFIPLLCAVLYLITQNFVFVVGYNVALAECFADTVASSVGSLSARAFDLFKMKWVDVGLSGGMSLVGTFAAAIAAFAFLLISVAFGVIGLSDWVVLSLAAFFGSVFDSLLGSLLQAKYTCRKCGIITEKIEHCNEKTVLTGGLRFVTNDIVNLVSCAVTTVVIILIYIF